MSNIPVSTLSDTKTHYDLLGGLHGVVALMVIWYHVFKDSAFASNNTVGTPNHGYLVMDFFFILSDFVIDYAYNDRWGKSLTTKDFSKHRLIRLHPMIVTGATLGVITFCIQGSMQWDGTHVATSTIMLSPLYTIFSISAMPGVGYEVRGNGEMFPLSGPCRSLSLEYTGSILHALFIRRLSNRALTVFMVLLGVALAAFAVFSVSTYRNIGVGWALDGVNFLGDSLHIPFPFSLGMLMSCDLKSIKVRGAFWICTIALIALFSVPYLERLGPLCINGVYEALCVIVVFPIILWTGASGTTTGKQSTKICKFLGDISYPAYTIHYPLMHLFYVWPIENQLYTLGETWHVALCVFILNIIPVYLCLKLYDEPIRKYLVKRFLSKK